MKQGSITKKALLAITNDDESNQPGLKQIEGQQKPKTAPGEMLQFLEKESNTYKENKELLEQNKQLENKLNAWNSVIATKKIHPSLIFRSKWANRHDDSFLGQEYLELKDEIANTGGNVQPIKVRPIDGSDPQTYEIIFGHRRHRACLDLGIDVLATIEPLDDKALFEQMDRENRKREDLRPFEQGLMYRHALDEGLYLSGNQMAKCIGINQSTLSLYINLVNFPSEVIAAFDSPLDIQYRMIVPIGNLIRSNLPVIISRANEIVELKKHGEKLLPHKIYSFLVSSVEMNNDIQNTAKVVQAGKYKFEILTKKNKTVIAFQNFDAEQAKEIELLITNFINGLS